MTWHLNKEQFNAVIALNDSHRYEHFLKKVADIDELWSLKNEDGWVLAGDEEGNELVPVWPHPDYAQACVTIDWEGTWPESISLELWMEKWLPGIAKDNKLIAVFPTPIMQGFIVDSERMQADLEAELSLFEWDEND